MVVFQSKITNNRAKINFTLTLNFNFLLVNVRMFLKRIFTPFRQPNASIHQSPCKICDSADILQLNRR